MDKIRALSNIDVDDRFRLENVVTCCKSETVVDRLHRWAQSKSLWVYYFGSSCCTRNYFQAVGGDNKLADSHRMMKAYSPMQADLLLIAGPVSRKLLPEVKKVYELMPSPKWVLVIGACSSSGGLFNTSYNVMTDISSEIPVDVYVPGCPAAPEAIIQAFNLIREKVLKCGFKGR